MLANLVRILLIASLLAWSPAWCCCAVRAMAAGEEATGHTSETRFSCCSRSTSPQDERPVASCCKSRDSKCCEPEEQSPCRCADRIIEQQRLDTSFKVVAPRLNIDLLAVTTRASHDGARPVAPFIAECSTLRQWHPPPPSLLAQSCLLLL